MYLLNCKDLKIFVLTNVNFYFVGVLLIFVKNEDINNALLILYYCKL